MTYCLYDCYNMLFKNKHTEIQTVVVTVSES